MKSAVLKIGIGAFFALSLLGAGFAFAQSAPGPAGGAGAPAAPAGGQSPPSASQSTTTRPPAAAAPAPAPSVTPSPNAAPSPTASPSPTPDGQLAPNPDMPSSGAASTGDLVELKARPAAFIEAKANHDEIYAAIMGSLATIRTEVDKAGLKAAGHPIAVFLQADDDGFRYRAEVPLESAPADKTELSATVKLGMTPVGKSMRFEHRGAYDDIDATYEAITAYLDEKNIDAQDVFVEEYLNEMKTSDDPNLQVDIYVLLK